MKTAIRIGLSVLLLLAAWQAFFLPFREEAPAMAGAKGYTDPLSVFDFMPESSYHIFTMHNVTLLAFAFALALISMWIWRKNPIETRTGRLVCLAGSLAAIVSLGFVLMQTAFVESAIPHMPGDSGWNHAVVPGTLLLIAAIFICGAAAGVRLSYSQPVWKKASVIRYGALAGFLYGLTISAIELLAAYAGNMELDWMMLPFFLPSMIVWQFPSRLFEGGMAGWAFLFIVIMVNTILGVAAGLMLNAVWSVWKFKAKA